MLYIRHEFATERAASARALVKALLREMPGVSSDHRDECIHRVALYKITEADCKNKFRTRYMSNEALEIAQQEKKPNESGLLIHEHVTARQKVLKKLIEAKPEDVDEILDSIVACVVTKDEHRRLSSSSLKDLHGWDRYHELKIRVWDTEMNSQYI
jgi:16S rRNA C967 or C1407 C5-methylase (RsmB/RsmF family)